jgi:hypothetical protein
VNGLLDKILKQVLAAGAATADSTDSAAEVHIQPQTDPTATPPSAP